MDEVFPLKRDDELIRESDQVFIFDLLSYLVFGEENAQGLTFKPHAQTRSVITVTQCWDVYTGPKDQLEYSYTNCVSHSYWVDDALINNSNWNSEGGGSGDVGLEEEVQEVPALHRALRQEIYSRKRPTKTRFYG